MERSALGSIGLSGLALALLALIALFTFEEQRRMPEEIALEQKQEPESAAQKLLEGVTLPPPPVFKPSSEPTETEEPLRQTAAPETIPETLVEPIAPVQNIPDDNDRAPEPEPEIEVVEAAIAETMPDDTQPVETATPDAATTDATTAETLQVDMATVAEGRVLLRMMARGEGPDIQIGWPRSSVESDQLYQVLTSCYGMVSAILTQQNRLYQRDGASGDAWKVNRDKFSDFIREAQGRIPEQEKAERHAIQLKHAVSGRLVRVLPRNLDAGLAGALMRLADQLGHRNPVITANYLMQPQGVSLSDIRVNGVEIHTIVHLPSIPRDCV